MANNFTPQTMMILVPQWEVSIIGTTWHSTAPFSSNFEYNDNFGYNINVRKTIKIRLIGQAWKIQAPHWLRLIWLEKCLGWRYQDLSHGQKLLRASRGPFCLLSCAPASDTERPVLSLPPQLTLIANAHLDILTHFPWVAIQQKL